jgi:indolepyruvate ferredoxin oxidoreductase beta subunit
MTKAVWVLYINNYFPELCKYTLPTIKLYAQKIGADFNLITTRKYLEFPITYEKIQIYELGNNYDWNILIDADKIADEIGSKRSSNIVMLGAASPFFNIPFSSFEEGIRQILS